jgi:hypothetical protein
LKDAREGNIVLVGTTEPAAATGVTHMSTNARRMALLAGLLGLSATGIQAQAGEEKAAVLAVVDRLFDGMRANDGDMVQSVFVEGASLIGTEGRDGAPETSYLPAEDFASTVGEATRSWDEPYWDPIVQIHDHLATVWIKYAFYLDGTFSHCGIDALILTRTSEGWKIAALADTRESDNCELPPDRQPHSSGGAPVESGDGEPTSIS